MKAIIYAGIGLFSAASVYGVVDYYNTKNKGTLDKIYKEDVVPATPAAAPASTVALPEAATKTVSNTSAGVAKATTKKTRAAKRSVKNFKFSEFSRGRIEPPVIIEETTPVAAGKEAKKEND